MTSRSALREKLQQLAADCSQTLQQIELGRAKRDPSASLSTSPVPPPPPGPPPPAPVETVPSATTAPAPERFSSSGRRIRLSSKAAEAEPLSLPPEEEEPAPPSLPSPPAKRRATGGRGSSKAQETVLLSLAQDPSGENYAPPPSTRRAAPSLETPLLPWMQEQFAPAMHPLGRQYSSGSVERMESSMTMDTARLESQTSFFDANGAFSMTGEPDIAGGERQEPPPYDPLRVLSGPFDANWALPELAQWEPHEWACRTKMLQQQLDLLRGQLEDFRHKATHLRTTTVDGQERVGLLALPRLFAEPTAVPLPALPLSNPEEFQKHMDRVLGHPKAPVIAAAPKVEGGAADVTPTIPATGPSLQTDGTE
eukprot:TRINITY_DN41845_c0_g1_i1.p1 TRINITY_DN41845_c0_g1~~TRINITY_DN41845_c0_g1_i1.p1  ORF type:complete len:382 (+),score=58.58 TRINITY_DN41845_c0_g1_i1:48-1148(+)